MLCPISRDRANTEQPTIATTITLRRIIDRVSQHSHTFKTVAGTAQGWEDRHLVASRIAFMPWRRLGREDQGRRAQHGRRAVASRTAGAATARPRWSTIGTAVAPPCRSPAATWSSASSAAASRASYQLEKASRLDRIRSGAHYLCFLWLASEGAPNYHEVLLSVVLSATYVVRCKPRAASRSHPLWPPKR